MRRPDEDQTKEGSVGMKLDRSEATMTPISNLDGSDGWMEGGDEDGWVEATKRWISKK
jgi:hypothetical protein